MRRLLIVGAGGFGREVLDWAKDIESTGPGWRIGGFLDANLHALSEFCIDLPVVGDPETFVPDDKDCFVCAIGAPATKRRVVTRLLGKGAKFLSLIHSRATVGSGCRIGVGCVLCPGVVITTSVTLGDFVTLNLGSTVGHDASVGDWCSLMVHADVAGHVQMGKGVLAGSHAFVLQGLRIGDDSVLGAGSVVTRCVESGATVFGNPAKQICINVMSNFGRTGGDK